MIFVKLAAEAVTWSSWLWQHRQDFSPVFQRLGEMGDFAQAALANPDGALRRVGNALVFGQPDGGEKVLAFIEQTSPKLDAIQQAVDGIGLGQAALSASLASLQTLSMMTLGLTALTHVVLAGQFVYLRHRLGNIDAKLQQLAQKIDATNEAKLKAGLTFLAMGEDFLKRKDRDNAHRRLNSALDKCVDSWQLYAGLLGNELNGKQIRAEAVRLLARHFAVALTATAACQIGLEQDDQAVAQIDKELPLLRQATQWVFQQTIGRDPARYLAPELGQHVSLRYLAELFRQAKDAGALDASHPCSEASLFEALRPRLYGIGRPFFKLRGTWLSAMLAELQQAMAMIEETNRVQGLERLIKEARRADRKTTDVIEEVQGRLSKEDAESCPYVAWGLA